MSRGDTTTTIPIEWAKYEDINFVRWEEDGLIVQTIDETEEKVGLAEIGERIDALKRSRLQKE